MFFLNIGGASSRSISSRSGSSCSCCSSSSSYGSLHGTYLSPSYYIDRLRVGKERQSPSPYCIQARMLEVSDLLTEKK